MKITIGDGPGNMPLGRCLQEQADSERDFTIAYEPCVIGSDGRCTRWLHDHSEDEIEEATDAG